ncbi:ATP-binding protein [Salininema proteolyticum]|uniref:histidine kinase n=1 Tax=Salininema proteolyticum TaxID=1607685 RepID=A0ABV8TUK5_9ACTN
MPEQFRPTAQQHHQAGRGPDPYADRQRPTGLTRRPVQLVVLPSAASALLAAGAVAAMWQLGATTVVGLVAAAVAAVLIGAVIALAARSANAQEDELSRRLNRLRLPVAEAHYGLWQLFDQLQRHLPTEQQSRVPAPPSPSAVPAGQSLGLMAQEVAQLRQAVEAVAAVASRIPAQEAPKAQEVSVSETPGHMDGMDTNHRVGIFVNLARRLQSLVHREIQLLDELEQEVEDPELLKGLFAVDHLATRIRRHAENLAVLGGATSRRQWSRPVNVYEALRSAVSEVEQYARVKLVRPVEGTLKGHAVADIIHLVAELVENATAFSPPQTQVLLRVQRVSAGLAIEVEDRGLGMDAEERESHNRMLSSPDEVNLDDLLADGRIGLFVVSSLARRHDLTVQLQTNIFGGTQAVMVVGDGLLGDSPGQEALPAPPAPAAAPAAPARAELPREPAAPHGAGEPAPSFGSTPPAAPNPSYGAPSAPQEAAPAYAAGVPSFEPSPGPSEPGRMLPVDDDRAPFPSPPGESTIVPLPSQSVQARQGEPIPSTVPAQPAPAAMEAAQPSVGARPQPVAGGGATSGLPRRPIEAGYTAPAPGSPTQPEPAPAPEADSRPELPRRQRQTHMAPQLRQSPGATGSTVAEQGHDPYLMKSFTQGLNQGEPRGEQAAPGTDTDQPRYTHKESQ